MNEDVTIGSSNIDVGDSLRGYAREHVLAIAEKYMQRLTKAGVHFNHEGSEYRCTVNMQMGALPMMSAEAIDQDAYRSFDRAAEKLAKQLRRTKRELRDDKPARVDKRFPAG
ncbi:MAG TPA: ribosome-associated translation inhibitor RaiA [Beijerinckiaceae bacterium]